MRTAIVIPARYASSRLPAKPLLRETGKYLIQHVYEQAIKSKADRVIVATDDQRIFDACLEFGAEVVLTRDDHASGTDRIAEVAQNLTAEIIINLQGDEPLIPPQHLDLLPNLLLKNAKAMVATLAEPITRKEDWQNPNCVKVVCDSQGNALYFSRSPIPHVRDGEPDLENSRTIFLRHVGIYAYRKEFLLEVAKTPPDPLEKLEKLEQLRILGLGQSIQVGIVDHTNPGVDTPEDYARFVKQYQKNQSSHAA